MEQSKFLIDDETLMVDLKKLPVFAPLATEDLQHLLRMSKLRLYRSGEAIIEEGKDDAWLYFFIYGRVKILSKGRELSTITRSGDVFGEMRFIDGTPRVASAYADGDTVCLALDTSYLETLPEGDKVAFGYILYRILAGILVEKLRETTQELMTCKERPSCLIGG